jgi:hypothetical protein
MVFHARQHGELNPSHHVGPDATSHRPLTTLSLYHRLRDLSIVILHKVLHEKIVVIVHFDEIPAFSPQGGRRFTTLKC